jgi:hypothetical protein
VTPPPRWTLSVLTIPEREPYLTRLLRSLDPAVPLQVDVIYNRALPPGEHDAIEARLQALAPAIPVEVYFNPVDTSIAGGRALQLSVCKTALVAFVDDDLSLHGDTLAAAEEAVRRLPLAIVGLPSKRSDTEERFKPRDSTPSVEHLGLRFMPVQGMFCAGYRQLFADVGGFNPRRRFWGEWTELNLRLWRHGFPTAYVMDRGFLRHWEDAPSSPTRNLDGREAHVVWGLICTALEYDAVDSTEATREFWRLVESRYLAYSYGEQLTPSNVLKTVLDLTPQLSAEWGNIVAYRERTRAHPFPFKPFHPLTLGDVKRVVKHAEQAIAPYRAAAFDDTRRSGAVPAVAHPPGTLVTAWRRLTGSVRRLGGTLRR